jgi:hypothetical protein
MATPAVLPLDTARWQLAKLWFPACAILFILLAVQSLIGVYQGETQRVWGWALPNFFPTLALMSSVFAADAFQHGRSKTAMVRKNFCRFALWLSVFYLLLLFLSVLSPPLINYFSSGEPIGRIQILELSSIWLGPVQGIVVGTLGVLFFLKEENRESSHGER